MIYNINDIFTSIQGEGINTGIPATFVRAQGCPVGCPWCDSGPNYHSDVPPLETDIRPVHTPSKGNTWPGNGGTKMEAWEIVSKIPPSSMLIIITGGEPALQNWDDFINALERVRGNRHHTVALETSGQYAWLGDRIPDHTTVSPKPYGRVPWYVNPGYWPYVTELKYVVDDMFEPDIVDRHLGECTHAAPTRVKPEIVLMPEGCPPKPEYIIKATEWAIKYNWRVSDRLQYRWGVK
jgi:7-carboxy-7-deazaguanine synthase